MALKSMGTRGYARLIERQIELTGYLAERIDALEHFERVGQVETAVCCFRFLPPRVRARDGAAHDEVQRALQQAVERSREAWVSTTVLKGRRAVRVNINSFLTERRHVDDLVELLRRKSEQLMKEGEI